MKALRASIFTSQWLLILLWVSFISPSYIPIFLFSCVGIRSYTLIHHFYTKLNQLAQLR